LNELAIQYYAQENYAQSLALFAEARSIYDRKGGSYCLKSWIVSNNMLCVYYSMRQINVAYEILIDMKKIQKQINAKVQLDVLQLATSLGNLGCICVQMKLYDIVSGANYSILSFILIDPWNVLTFFLITGSRSI
jgi:hypothetical protein